MKNEFEHFLGFQWDQGNIDKNLIIDRSLFSTIPNIRSLKNGGLHLAKRIPIVFLL